MTTKVEESCLAPNEEDVQPLSEIMCNCELCYARLCVSRQNIEDNPAYGIDQADHFHIPAYNKAATSYMPCAYAWTGAQMCGDGNSPSNIAMSRLPYQMMGSDTFVPMYPTQEWPLRSQMVGQMPCDGDFGMTVMSPRPQLYVSKESVLHLRLSAYVALERSSTAFRLMNYRNNSALALSENGEYGYVYHYNCRGLINMHHEKLSITFDKERQILLRTEKPSFVKKENEYYRLTSHHWTQCRPVSMDFFDRDRTPEILKKSGPDKSTDEAKLMDLINSSVIQKDSNGLTIYLGEARIEQRLNGDVTLSWMYGERVNSLVVSPLTGSVSLSTRNLEIIATPKNDIYISFADFFVHTGSQQMTVSSGAISGRGSYSKSHPCLLKLVTIAPPSEMADMRQFCPYIQNQHGGSGGGGSHKHHGKQQQNVPATTAPETPTPGDDIQNSSTSSDSPVFELSSEIRK